MSDTTFIDRKTPIYAEWLNDVNDATYKGEGIYPASVQRTVKSKLQESISVKDFGAIADSDGTSGNGTDNTVAIQNAVNAAVAQRRHLTFPTENGAMYRITAPISILVEPITSGFRKGVIIEGEGPGAVIFNDSTGDTFVLDSTAGAADMGTQIKIKNLSFHSNTGTRPTSFIRNKKGINTKVYDCQFMSVYVSESCITNEVAYGLTLRDSVFRGVVGTGLLLRQSLIEANGYSFVVSVENCDFSFCTTGIYAEGANCLSIKNTPIQQCTDGLVVDPTINGVSAFNILLENVWFENNNNWDINFNSNVSSWCEATILRCQFGRGSSNTKINLGTKSRIVVEGIAAGPGSVEVTGSGSASFTGVNTTPKYIQNGSFYWVEYDAAGGFDTPFLSTDGSFNVITKAGAFVSAAGFKSASGSVSVPNATATTLFTMPSATNAVYLLSTTAGSSGPAAWTSVAIVSCSASLGNIVMLQTGSNLTLTRSGLAIQATQSIGGTVSISWTATRIQ